MRNPVLLLMLLIGLVAVSFELAPAKEPVAFARWENGRSHLHDHAPIIGESPGFE